MATRSDPTRTTILRRRFIRQMRKRFLIIQRLIRALIIEDDALGLVPEQPFFFNVHSGVGRQAWRFQTDPQKMESFRRWLVNQIDQNILTTDALGLPWTAEFMEAAYEKGVNRAFTDSRGVASQESLDFFEGSKTEFLRAFALNPANIAKIGLLTTRSFEELRGVTAAMSQQLNRELALGLAAGHNPRRIARNMVRRIQGLTKTRAEVIARTETIAAHAEGQLDAFEALGVQEVGILAEFRTAGDDRVCPQCNALEGALFTIQEARGIIPRHPNCRCAFLPQIEAEKRNRRKRTLRKVRRSIQAERPKASAREATRRSTFVGKELL